jgi:hypothetical protein
MDARPEVRTALRRRHGARGGECRGLRRRALIDERDPEPARRGIAKEIQMKKFLAAAGVAATGIELKGRYATAGI